MCINHFFIFKMTFLLLLGDSWANYIFLLIHWEFCAMCLDHIHPLPIIHLRSALFFYVPNAVSFEKRKTSCSICTTHMFLNMCHFTAVCLIYQRVPYKKKYLFSLSQQLPVVHTSLAWDGMKRAHFPLHSKILSGLSLHRLSACSPNCDILCAAAPLCPKDSISLSTTSGFSTLPPLLQ